MALLFTASTREQSQRVARLRLPVVRHRPPPVLPLPSRAHTCASPSIARPRAPLISARGRAAADRTALLPLKITGSRSRGAKEGTRCTTRQTVCLKAQKNTVKWISHSDRLQITENMKKLLRRSLKNCSKPIPLKHF